MADIKRVGFGQVEPNHLSGQITGQLYAQLPCKSTITILENGQFAKYDYAKNEVNFTGEGEWMLVFNEVKLYDSWRETYKDFAMKKTNYTEGVMTPRLMKTNVGDIFTTNAIKMANTSGTATVAGEALVVGDTLGVNADGFLASDGDTTDMEWQVVKVYTLADGQPAVKVMRIK